jgi:NAD(P)-dependent dehydrogenase (short-subunit alcohol dehydrogenase family)
MDMEGKVALVTGANRGLGRALTQALAERGATVLMVCRDEDAGAEVEEELRASGLDVTLYLADMASIDDIEALQEEVAAEFDRLDVLVNCAGVNLDSAETTVENIPLAVLETTVAINFMGPFWMCKQFLPLLRQSPSGRIINFSSGIGRLTMDAMGPYPAYSISKTAINALTKTLASEVAGTGIIVVAVDPGWARTDMGGPDAPLSIEEGIDTPLWLATADASELQSGRLYHLRKAVSW